MQKFYPRCASAAIFSDHFRMREDAPFLLPSTSATAFVAPAFRFSGAYSAHLKKLPVWIARPAGAGAAPRLAGDNCVMLRFRQPTIP